jgi:AmmeMemoRadiSam system protein B
MEEIGLFSGRLQNDLPVSTTLVQAIYYGIRAMLACKILLPAVAIILLLIALPAKAMQSDEIQADHLPLCEHECKQTHEPAQQQQVSAQSRTHHYSYFSKNPQVLASFLKEAGTFAEWKAPPDSRIIAGIVPHHSVAVDMIIDFYQALSRMTQTYKHVIIIGPDHFQHGLHDISLSVLPWHTAFGELNVDTDTIQQLAQHLQLPLDQEAFFGEHSISMHMDFIQKFLPGTTVIPVMLQPRLDPAQAEKLSSFLFHLMSADDTLLILSMDFAHYCTPAEANENDRVARNIIADRMLNKVYKANVDCKSGLYTFLRIMNEIPESHIIFRQHANSAELLHQPDSSDTTSYFTLYGVVPRH